uniref:Uncharacterized protein n=1 Tax=Arundo donax TaxID=35708 RepID=A0A0A9DI05_ARUDO
MDDINGQFLNKLFLDNSVLSGVVESSADSTAPSTPLCLCRVSGSHAQLMKTTVAKIDIHRHGRRYGNLPKIDFS